MFPLLNGLELDRFLQRLLVRAHLKLNPSPFLRQECRLLRLPRRIERHLALDLQLTHRPLP